MKKIFKYVLLVSIFSLFILFFSQSLVKAGEMRNINTMEELKTAFGQKAVIEGNTIKLTDNVVLNDLGIDIQIPEVTIDFNGKTLECKGTGVMRIYKKATFEDNSTTDKLKWGGVIFNRQFSESIHIDPKAELTINNGKFVDAGIKTSSKIYVAGKLTINNATFSTTRTTPAADNNYMIKVRGQGHCIINNGEFTHMDSIIYVGGDKYAKSKLTVNGGNFNCSYTDAIYIYAMYPTVNKDNSKDINTPKVILNNCNIKAKHSAIGFWGGCTDEQYRNAEAKILTILGGTYQCSANSNGAPLEIRTYTEPSTYFNPKDFDLQGGTFESLDDTLGAIRLLGPSKRRIQNNL